MVYIKTIFFSIIFLLFSCGGSSEITEEVEGTYKFLYPSGQVELISIKNDLTFIQTIYSNESDYLNNHEALYRNNGSWKINGKQLEFDHWLSYCYMLQPDSILPKPNLSIMPNVYWDAPTVEHSALLTFYDQENYIFTKINN